MDVCTPTSQSASKDLTYFAKLCLDPLESTCEVLGRSINEVGDSLTNLLNIRDDNKVVPVNSLTSARNGVGKKDFCEEALPTQLTTVTSKKSLSKSTTFPSSSMTTLPAAVVKGEPKDQSTITTAEELSQNNNPKSVIPPCQRSVSLPTPSKLLSAMKGSREKQGIPPKAMSITWAPDVYDPIPTAASHVPTNKPLKHHKKNSKNKQKGSSRTSSGSKSKTREKKKAQKHGGSSSRGLKIPNQGEKTAEFEDGQIDFVIGNPDAYCGTSFLKKSIASLHFSIAEAS